MERIRIRSMLNHIKKTQKIEENLKFTEIQLKCSTEDSNSQVFSCRNKDIDGENQCQKYNSFTLDAFQQEGSGDLNANHSGHSLGQASLPPFSEISKKRVPIKCFAYQFQRKKRSQSQNLEELGIGKKCLTSRKQFTSNDRKSHFHEIQKSTESYPQDNPRKQKKHFQRFSSQKQIFQTFNCQSAAMITMNPQRRSPGKNQKRKTWNDHQIRIRNMKTIDLSFRPSAQPKDNEQICPWNTTAESTNLHYTLNF